MRKKIFSRSILLITLLSFSVGLMGCTGNENKTPQQIIQDAYGNKEFKISFSSESLDKPLEDVTYSANKIPLLPTPEKVGYIFEGWFLDPEFICPYTDDTLLLHMSDLTLYPKWSKERFDHNGTYDIRFEGRIIPESVRKGKATDRYGGYRDFTKLINAKETHIEKDSDNLVLKLQFDSVVTTPFQSAGSVFTVTPNSKMPSDIRVINKIDSLADSVKTLFIRINSWDLSKPLLLDVSWTNFEHKDLAEENRYDTTTSYTVELSIAEIIGFSQPFVDTSAPLEKGYYLAKSYYRKEDNGESMGSIYNPVYSYLYSDGKENYKLIKQNSPYLGLVAQEHPLFDPITDNYYERMMAFTALTTVFDIESRGNTDLIESDYYPFTYNAGHYRETATEFHSDTSKFYNIIDIDKDLTKEYLALTAVSGFMEKESGMGYIRQILSIDYTNLIKLADCDYEPLSGGAYEYEDSFGFYPGNYQDLETKNLIVPSMEKYGISFDMPNFYYSAPTMNASIKNRTIYSSRVTTTPDIQTANLDLSSKESRYRIGEFNVHAEIFGYEERSGESLFLDRMAPQGFEGKGYNNMLRYNRIIKNGKTVDLGETIKPAEIFSSMVNNDYNYSDVSVKGYEINEREISFDKPIIINEGFQFRRDIALEFSYTNKDGYLNKTIVELRKPDNPYIRVLDDLNWKLNKDTGHYETNEVFNVGDKITYPIVEYDYGRCKNVAFVDDFYGQGAPSINPAKSYILSDIGSYKKLYLPTALTKELSIPNKNISIVYELNNEYNERQFIYFDYISHPSKSFEVRDSDNNLLSKEIIKYDNEGRRNYAYVELSYEPYYDLFSASMLKSYRHIEDGRDGDYDLMQYNIFSNAGNSLVNIFNNNEELEDTINSFLADKKYGLVSLIYRHGNDEILVSIPYNLTFNGEGTYKALDYEAFFTNTTYTYATTNLIADRNAICQVNVELQRLVDGVPYYEENVLRDFDASIDGSQVVMEFKTPGTYRLVTKYYIPDTILGDMRHRNKLVFYQMLDVQSDKGEVTITYKTDALHPFKGGLLEKTVPYNLAEGIRFMTDSKDVFYRNDFADGRREDVLLSWNTMKNSRGDNYKRDEYLSATDFISSYNTNNLVVYAIWDMKIVAHFVINDDVIHVTASPKSGSDRNEYVIKFPNPPKQVKPTSPKFAYWTGGFLGSSHFTDNEYVFEYNDAYLSKPAEYFTITAVFQEQYQVKFITDSSLSEIVMGSVVGDGECIPNAEAALKPIMKDKNHRFVKYMLRKSDGTLVEIGDLRDFIVGDDKVTRIKLGVKIIELVAIYEEI